MTRSDVSGQFLRSLSMNIPDPDHSESSNGTLCFGWLSAIVSSLFVTLKSRKKLESPVRVERCVLKETPMKKRKAKSSSGRFDDTMRPEYDFSKAVCGVTAARYGEGSNVVLLDPDVAEIFPNARAVNEALRTFARLTKSASRPRPRKTLGGPARRSRPT
jgi:hypothetical protein